MDKPERQRRIAILRPWALSLQPLMGLAHWRIRISDEQPVDTSCFAEFHQWINGCEADIRIGDQFFTQEPDDQRETLVHEYLHGHMKLFKHLFADLEHNLAKVLYQHVDTQFYHAEEMTVDALSRVIAPHLPLPPPLPPVEETARKKSIVGAELY